MAAGSPEGEEGRNGGGSGNPERHDRASATALSHARDAEDAEDLTYEDALAYAHSLAYVSLAVKSSGLLALFVSTAILLSDVQSLRKEDFFCITVISVIQAAGIFKDYCKSAEYLFDFVFTSFFLIEKLLYSAFNSPLLLIPLLPVLYPLLIGILCADLVLRLGPLACAAISSWRIARLNHGNRDGTDSVADMMAATNIFYSLIIFQGAVFVVLFFILSAVRVVVTGRLHDLEQLPREWGGLAIHTYLYDMSVKCRKDPLSTKGLTLIKYAAELLDSESQEDYLYGARLLSAFITKGKGEDVRRLLLPSTGRIQRLLDSLWIGRGGLDESSTEIRELAATILADLAGHIDVARYPGGMCCISSLLLEEETTQTYRRCISDPQRPLTKGKQGKEKDDMREGIRNFLLTRDKMDPRRPVIREEQRRRNSQGGTSNKLVQQGLTILERLASNSGDNRRIICGAPRLLPKITAPVYSATLTEDIKTKAWADIVTRCLKVLYQLIRAPDGSHEIFSNKVQALSNLTSILQLSNNEADHQELQLVAMEILTELNEEVEQVLITKQLDLFLANGDAAAMAGRTLASLSTNNKSNSALIMNAPNDIIDRLTGILDDENITRRTIAAEIMANLCAHCNVVNMKEILSKVLRKTMYIKGKSQQKQISEGQNNPTLGDEENQGNSASTTTNNAERPHNISAHGDHTEIVEISDQGQISTGHNNPELGDEENQGTSGSTKNEERQHNNSTQGDHTEIKEISDQERDEQEAFLYLAQVICDKLNNSDLDGAIQSAVDQNITGSEEQRQRRREAFVDKLKTIIDNNCHPAADSLRIVKLCSHIAKSMLRCQQYVEIFRNREFKSSLSEASKTMSELESCMLFVGTDFGVRNTVRPLFFEIENSFGQI